MWKFLGSACWEVLIPLEPTYWCPSDHGRYVYQTVNLWSCVVLIERVWWEGTCQRGLIVR